MSDERDELFELDGVDALESVSGSISESLRIVSLGERMGERASRCDGGWLLWRIGSRRAWLASWCWSHWSQSDDVGRRVDVTP